MPRPHISSDDPTRIPTLLNALRDVWEGQPDLTLATLWGIIENNPHIGWGTDDSTTLDVLRSMARERPAAIPLDSSRHAKGTFLVHAGETLATLSPDTVVIRRQSVQPVVWNYAAIRSAQVSAPLVLEDEEGQRRRYGVVSSIRRLCGVAKGNGGSEAKGVVGASRRQVSGRVYVVVLTGGDVAVLGRRLEFFHVDRRAVGREMMKYDTVTAQPGEQLEVVLPGGAGKRSFGEVERLILAEVE